MQFTILAAALSLAGAAVASPSYHCGGQELCSTMQKKFCDITVNEKLIRNDDINYGAPTSDLPESGSCTANLAKFGCGVFVRGPEDGDGQDCKFSGNQMWHDYQEIMDSGCGKCGYKEYDDGCQVVVDYVSDCQK